MWLILVFLSQTMQTSLKGLTLISTPHHTWHWASWMNLIVFSFFKINLFIYFIFGCVGSSLLRAGFLWLRRAGTILCYGVRVSHCSGFSCCGARALGSRASVVAVRRLSSCGSWALECRLSNCGTWASLLRGMWDLPGPGLKPVSPALAGGFFF